VRYVDGDPRQALKARVIVNKMIAPVVIEQHSDGSVWANYALRPAALLAQSTAVGIAGAQESLPKLHPLRIVLV